MYLSISPIGPNLPQGVSERNFYLPLTAVYGRWYKQICELKIPYSKLPMYRLSIVSGWGNQILLLKASLGVITMKIRQEHTALEQGFI
jgi:hypothetical protein